MWTVQSPRGLGINAVRIMEGVCCIVLLFWVEINQVRCRVTCNIPGNGNWARYSSICVAKWTFLVVYVPVGYCRRVFYLLTAADAESTILLTCVYQAMRPYVYNVLGSSYTICTSAPGRFGNVHIIRIRVGGACAGTCNLEIWKDGCW